MAMKYAAGALLSGATFWMLVVYYLMQLDPAVGASDDVDFMRHPNVRSLMNEKKADDQAQRIADVKNPDNFAQVNINAVTHKPTEKPEEKPAAKGSGEKPDQPIKPPGGKSGIPQAIEGDEGHKVDIVFGVCCRKDYSLIKTLDDEFVSVFYNTAIEPLQKATAITPLKATTDKTDLLNRLSTLLSTDDISVHFKESSHGVLVGQKTSNSNMSPLMVTFTISGDAMFLHNFKRQLWLKSPLLESGLFTTIEAHLQEKDSQHQQGVLAVKWVSPRYHVPVVSLNSAHLADLSNEMAEANGILGEAQGNHITESASLQRQERKVKALQLEKNSLTQLIRDASQSVYPRLNVAFNQLIIGEMRHLKTRSFYIQRQIESLQMQHDSLSRVLKQTEREYKFEDANAKSNTVNIGHLQERLALLHRRRVEVIAELKKMVKRFEYMAHLIVYYEIYLREKQRHDQRFRGQRLRFEKGLCGANTINEFQCGQRAIYCEASTMTNSSDLFADENVKIKADVTVKANIDHQIYLYANAECNALTLHDRNKDRALTTHKCDKEADSPYDCELVDDKGIKKMEDEVRVLCVFVTCKNEANFSVITEIELQPTRDNALKAEAEAKKAKLPKAAGPPKQDSPDQQGPLAQVGGAADAVVAATANAVADAAGAVTAAAGLTPGGAGDGAAVTLPPTKAPTKAPILKPLPKESKATLLLAKTKHGKPKKEVKSLAQMNATDWARSEGSELKRTVTMAATVFFSVVALVMSVMFLPGLLFK